MTSIIDRVFRLGVAMACLAAGPAVADPWKDESGRGWHGAFEQEWKPGKYEWRAGNCKYEFKQDGGGFKEEYKCDGPTALAALPPPQRFVPRRHLHRGAEAPEFVLGPEAPLRGGRYCREYQKRVTVEGRSQRAYGTACRQPDGSWELVNR